MFLDSEESNKATWSFFWLHSGQELCLYRSLSIVTFDYLTMKELGHLASLKWYNSFCDSKEPVLSLSLWW